MLKRMTMMALLSIVAACGSADELPEAQKNQNVPSTREGPAPDLDDDEDKDGDGLTNGQERLLGTSPLMPDTDGDALTDFEEYQNGGFNPLVADVPVMNIQFVGDVDVVLDTTESENCSNSATTFASTLEAQETSYSKSDSRATRTTVEASVEVSATVSSQAFPPSASSEVSATASSSVSNTQERSTSFTSSSASRAQRELQQSNTRECFSGSETRGGTITMGFRISNPSDISYTLNDILLTVVQRRGDGRFATLGTTRPLESSVSLSGGKSTGTLTVALDVPARRALELIDNPSGLFFEVGTYDLVDEEERNYAFITQTTLTQTALVIVDYGPEQEAQRFHVATNVARDEAGRALGITMARALEILELPFATEPGYRRDGTRGPNTLAMLDGYTYDESVRQLWYAFGSPRGFGDGTTHFEEVVLEAGDAVQLVLVRDSDHDGLIDREELLHRSDPESAHSDDDALTDFEEAVEGWMVRTASTAYRVYSDPTASDRDGDGLDDAGERLKGTDPYDPDTDDDGLTDDIDEIVDGAYPVVIAGANLEQGTMDCFDLSARVVSSEALDTVRIDWGDGSVPYVARPVARELPLAQSHCFEKGRHTVEISAVDVDGYEARRVLRLNHSAEVLYEDAFVPGFARLNARTAGDVNGDGREDLIGFADDGIYVGIIDESGGLQISRWSSDLGNAAGYGDYGHERYVVDLNGDNCDDVIAFNDYSGQAVLSNCSSAFGAERLWVNHFGARLGYGGESSPRIFADMNLDGLPDIVGFERRTEYARNNGNGCDDYRVASEDLGRNRGWSGPRHVVDFDGDQVPDVVGFGDGGTWVALGHIDGTFSGRERVSDAYSTRTGWYRDQPRLLVDVDNDGRLDVIGFANPFTVVSLNTSTAGHASLAIEHTAVLDFNRDAGWTYYDYSEEAQRSEVDLRQARDVTGDGIVDIVGIDDRGVHVAKGRGDGTFEPRHLRYTAFSSDDPRLWDSAIDNGETYEIHMAPRLLLNLSTEGNGAVVGFRDDGVLVQPFSEVRELY